MQRATAALATMRGGGAVVQQLAERDRTIADLRQQVATLTSQLGAANTELAQFRADHAALDAALKAMDNKQADVTSAVAALGFQQENLPSASTIEQAENGTIEGLLNQFKAEADPEKKAELAQKMRELREKAPAKKG